MLAEWPSLPWLLQGRQGGSNAVFFSKRCMFRKATFGFRKKKYQKKQTSEQNPM